MTQKEIDLIWQVDEAKLTPDKHIETKYGLGTIRNLSSGCKTLLNIVKHHDKVVNVEECGPNVLRIIFTIDKKKAIKCIPDIEDYEYVPVNNSMLAKAEIPFLIFERNRGKCFIEMY